MARAPVLTMTRNFTSTLWWAPDTYLDALTLILAVTHVKDIFTSVPYALFTSDKPGSGKTTASTHIPALLADNAWEVNSMTTVPAIRAKFMDRVPPSALCVPDSGKIFGDAGLGGRTSRVYQLLVAGYLRNGKVEVEVNRVATKLPAFFVAFIDGLNNAVPNDLATRCVKFRLSPKPPKLRMRDALSVPVEKEAEPLRRELHRWANANRDVMRQFMLGGISRVHPQLTDRRLQLWGPMFAVAHAAGGDWPQRCLNAFLDMALDASERPVLQREEEALLDAGKIALTAGSTVLFMAELVTALRELPGEFYPEVDDGYLVTDLLPRALGPAKRVRGKVMDGSDTAAGEGWLTADVLERAAALHEELYPPPPDNGPDPVQQALTLNRTGGRR